MKRVRDDMRRLSTLLLDYIKPLGMLQQDGPLRAMREQGFRIWTSSSFCACAINSHAVGCWAVPRPRWFNPDSLAKGA